MCCFFDRLSIKWQPPCFSSHILRFVQLSTIELTAISNVRKNVYSVLIIDMKKPFMFLVLHSIRIKFYGKIRYGFQLKKLIQIDYHVNLPTSKYWAWALTILFVYASNFNYGYSGTNWMVFSHFFIAIFFLFGIFTRTYRPSNSTLGNMFFFLSFSLNKWEKPPKIVYVYACYARNISISLCVFFGHNIGTVNRSDKISTIHTDNHQMHAL